MIIKPHIRLIHAEKFKAIGQGVSEAALFCMLYASLIALISWIFIEYFNVPSANAGAIFAYLCGCSLFVREKILRIIHHAYSKDNNETTSVGSIASIATAILIVNIILLYFMVYF